jgi:hypothetical protein
MMSETVQANDGAMLPLDSIPVQIIYDGSFVSTMTVQYAGQTYQQTFLNDGTDIIYISNWINTANPPFASQVMVDESGVPMVDQNGQIMVTEAL